jgi:DNA-binding PadR family transcriptional regulator
MLEKPAPSTGRSCWDDPDYQLAVWGPKGPMIGMRRGDFRFLVMTALSEKPMHGYALIRELGQAYQRPVSAGLIYPTLQELEDRGYVTCEEKGGKKTYSVTQRGRECLEENRGRVERLKAGKVYADKMGQFGFLKDLREMQSLVMMNDEYMDKGKMERISGILGDAKKKVAAVVFE